MGKGKNRKRNGVLQRPNLRASVCTTRPHTAAISFPSHHNAQTYNKTGSRKAKSGGLTHLQKGTSLPKKNAPQTPQGESFFRTVLAAIVAGLLLLLYQQYNANGLLQVSLDNTKTSLENERGHSRQLEADIAASKKQNRLMEILGPHVVALQRLTVGRQGDTSVLHLGRCPNLPCFTIKYEGLGEIPEGNGDLFVKWEIDGSASPRREFANIGFSVPARTLCYGIFYAGEESVIYLILEDIPSPDSFNVVAALILPPSPAKEAYFFPPIKYECAKG